MKLDILVYQLLFVTSVEAPANFHGQLFIYCRRHTLYQCGELDKFIETVIGRVESLPVEKVAKVLNEFLKRYGSIEVAYHFQWSYFFRWSSFLD